MLFFISQKNNPSTPKKLLHFMILRIIYANKSHFLSLIYY